MLRFDFNEKVAITFENNRVITWGTYYTTTEPRLFTNNKGQKAILTSDKGSWWEREKKEAVNCWYAQLWLGDFPYSSWSWAIRLCKATGQVDVRVIHTDINPRGQTDSDLWESECRGYVPILAKA